MSIPYFLSKQLKRPKGFLGFFVSLLMNKVNKPMYTKSLNLLAFDTKDTVLEIGIGNGKFLNSIAEKVPNGLVIGIDILPTMVFVSRFFNYKLIQKNKVQILKSGVENLKIEKNTVDKILSINTIYFWKNPDQIMNELYRILKPKGKLLLAFNSKKEMVKSRYNPEIFTFYELSEVENLLKEANFTVIESSYEQFKIEDCHCIIAQKNA